MVDLSNKKTNYPSTTWGGIYGFKNPLFSNPTSTISLYLTI